MTNRAEALAKALERLSIAVENLDPQSGIPGGYQALIDASNAGDAALEAYRSQPDGWRPISELSPKQSRAMFVVKAFDADIGKGVRPYTSDAYCVWREGETFVRWPHPFPPTHFMELPAPPNSKEQQ